MNRFFIFIAIGGGLGAIFRNITSTFITKFLNTSFPLDTLIINLFGCFLIGVFISFGDGTSIMSRSINSLVLTGFIGAFTTYSTFSNDSYLLIREGRWYMAIIFILISNLIGILMVALGYQVFPRILDWVIKLFKSNL